MAVPAAIVTFTVTDADGAGDAAATTRTVCPPPSSATPVTASAGEPPSSNDNVIVADCPTTETGAAGANPNTKPANNPNANTRLMTHLP